jgi:hypothetical protein
VATVIRYLLLALELAREGAITDATLGNDYYREVLFTSYILFVFVYFAG